MNTSTKTGLIAALLLTSGAASADWSANLGFASDYYYRGIFQSEYSISGGVDFESSGFYVGTWAADVGDGAEVDGYFGYGGEVGGFSYGIGYTGYFYTGDFDDTYQEINLGAGLGLFTFEVAIGKYDNFGGDTQDYVYYALSVEKNGFYGKYGGFSQDFEGEYFETGYGTTVAGIDLGLYLLFSNEDLVGENEESIVLTIGKSFGL
jgi:uncharacterized protein (TIGR02001 family)